MLQLWVYLCNDSSGLYRSCHSMCTGSFLCALISRSVNPSETYSDNGTTFVGAARILRNTLQEPNPEKMNCFPFHLLLLSWFCNRLGASLRRDTGERIIHSTGRILGALLESQTSTEEAINTVTAEVELRC